jgi:hypothetical protein
MPIPNLIERHHILNVIHQIDNGRIIPTRRSARRVFCIYNHTRYPVKILISWAFELITGNELPYNLFITKEAVKVLGDLNFDIVYNN